MRLDEIYKVCCVLDCNTASQQQTQWDGVTKHYFSLLRNDANYNMEGFYNTQRTAEGANSVSAILLGQGHIHNSRSQPQVDCFHTDEMVTGIASETSKFLFR